MPQPEQLCHNLADWLTTRAGRPVVVSGLRRLTGGASLITWVVDTSEGTLVVRQDAGSTIQDDALTRPQEFALLQAVHAAGIRVARPRWLCPSAEVLGAPFFVVDHVAGESVGRRVVREPALAEARRLLPRQLAEQLARLHSLDACAADFSFLPRPAGSPALAAVEAAGRLLEQLGEPHPVLELAIRWLHRHAPGCDRLVLCHGDYRVGNLLVGPDGLRAIIDWEFAHLGDPAEDLAWLCVRSWRFGQDELRLGGIAGIEEFVAVYADLTRQNEENLRQRMQYWEIVGNLRWAVGCVRQAWRHLSGQTPSLELASLGRRTAEMELELIELLSQTGLSNSKR